MAIKQKKINQIIFGGMEYYYYICIIKLKNI